jgi:polysaccharide biosynthesis protein PslH
MKVLWITTQFPCLRSGAQVRQFHLLRNLSQSHEIILLSLISPSESQEVKTLTDYGITVFTEAYEPPPAQNKWINRFRSYAQVILDPKPNFSQTFPIHLLIKRVPEILDRYKPQVVNLESLYVGALRSVIREAPVILVDHNVEYKNYLRQVDHIHSVLRKAAGRIEAAKLRAWERSVIRRCAATVAVSEEDALEIRWLSPGASVFIVPNGVDCASFIPPSGEENQRKDLIFFGNLGYQPNVDGIHYFARDIFPHICRQHPDVNVKIIGLNAPGSVIDLGQQPGIEFIGYVKDVRPYLWDSLVSVVPVRSGGGTRLKILESLAAGCAVVTTTVGVEGLALVDNQAVLIADEPEQFSASVNRLLDHPNLACGLVENGRKVLNEKYDWDPVTAAMNQVLQAVARQYDG